MLCLLAKRDAFHVKALILSLPFGFLCLLLGFLSWVLAMSDEETKEEKELDLSSPDIVTKYKLAAEIANSEFLSLSLSL